MNLITKIINKFHYLYKKRQLFKNGIIIKGSFDFKCKFMKPNYIGKGSVVLGCELGKYSYLGNYCILTNVKIGNFCSIGDNVKLIAACHPISFVSTSPVFYSKKSTIGTFVSEQKFNDYKYVKGTNFKVIIEHDVWIGSDSILMGGIKIGTGAIIAAGAVVTKDVLPYSIVGGCPAKHIKFRFAPDIIAKLLECKWWDQDDLWINENSKYFNCPEELLRH